jgi:dipeptidyl aminopeptidase/acylaminoacyl peptidase
MYLTLPRGALAIATVFTASATLGADLIPIERFFQRPVVSGASLSPSGRHLALRQLSPAGRSMLKVVDTRTNSQTSIASYSNGDVANFAWLNDQYLSYKLVNVDVDGELVRNLTSVLRVDAPPNAKLAPETKPPRSFADDDYVNTDYLAAPTLHGFSDLTKGIRPTVLSEPRNDVLTHGSNLVFKARQIIDWMNDETGYPRVAVSYSDETNRLFLYADDKKWRQIAAAAPQSRDALNPVLYAGGALYVRTDNGHDTSSIYRYDAQTNRLDAKPLISVPGYDADGYFVLAEQKILGFRINTDAETTAWMDADMKAVQDQVDALLPDNVNTLSPGTHNITPLVLVDSYSDVQDHRYLLYHRETKKIWRVGEARPQLDQARMSHMRMVHYLARDGMRIPAYITMPASATKKPAPLVVLMGDTQWKRNGSWAWDAEVQFLASRGYIVLQPNPRGTPGFGRAHEVAGAKQWGRAIQDDIADAASWAVAQGYADPARICIAGSGYGGYAAMMALARDPALFKCGISWSGYTDLPAMFGRDWKHIVPARKLAALYDSVGTPKQDEKLLQQISPLQNAARITQPVLLAYGKEDARVPFSEGRAFYQALAATNRQVNWLEYTPSVEEAKTQANRIDLWRNIEAFLSKYIGP